MKKPACEMQIGKQGLTESFIETIKQQFDKRENIKIHVLKSARESKKDVEKFAEQIIAKLGPKFTCKTIGFSIFLKKWRKARG